MNEYGISETEHVRRYEQFWNVSKYIRDVSYQTVLETSLKNISSSGIPYPNNYSTGDMYGDVFVTKSILNSNYDMELGMSEKLFNFISRDYIGLGNCSNQLFLVFNPTVSTFTDEEGSMQLKK